MDKRHVNAAFALGADAVQIGTALLSTQESGASDAHKAVLANSNYPSTFTTCTRALTGREARMFKNDIVQALEPHQEKAMFSALQRTYMADIFKQRDPRYSPLYAGQSHRLCRQETVAEFFSRLI